MPTAQAGASAGEKDIRGGEESKEENLDYKQRAILDFAGKHGKVTNDDVQKLLGVADVTATNYLRELKNKKELIQVGRWGRGIYYRLPKKDIKRHKRT